MYLQGRTEPVVRLSFSDIERIPRGPAPCLRPSASPMVGQRAVGYARPHACLARRGSPNDECRHERSDGRLRALTTAGWEVLSSRSALSSESCFLCQDAADPQGSRFCRFAWRRLTRSIGLSSPPRSYTARCPLVRARRYAVAVPVGAAGCDPDERALGTCRHSPCNTCMSAVSGHGYRVLRSTLKGPRADSSIHHAKSPAYQLGTRTEGRERQG